MMIEALKCVQMTEPFAHIMWHAEPFGQFRELHHSSHLVGNFWLPTLFNKPLWQAD